MKKLLIRLIVLAGIIVTFYLVAVHYIIPQYMSSYFQNEQKEIPLINEQMNQFREGLNSFIDILPDSMPDNLNSEVESPGNTNTGNTSNQNSIHADQLTKTQLYRLIDDFKLNRADQLSRKYKNNEFSNENEVFDMIKKDILEHEQINIEPFRKEFNSWMDLTTIDSLNQYYRQNRALFAAMLPAIKKSGKEIIYLKLQDANDQ